jgi:hypothetical protein
MNTFRESFARLGSSASHSEAATGESLYRAPVNAMFCPRRADVAQLVEQRFRKPQVTGSNPVVG